MYHLMVGGCAVARFGLVFCFLFFARIGPLLSMLRRKKRIQHSFDYVYGRDRKVANRQNPKTPKPWISMGITYHHNYI